MIISAALIGPACIITAILTGKDHPRRRGFGDTTDGGAKGVGCLKKFMRGLLLFLP